MANTYLTRTTNTSGASRTTWTWSGWIKRGTLSGQQDLFSAYASDNDYMNVRFFEADENIQFRVLIGGNFAARKYTTRKFRDISAWYHLVIVWDTTNSSASQRMRIYVNGVQETSFATSANPSSGLQGQINASGSMQIGAKNGADFFNGSMSHVHFADGQALAPSVFGETDATTGEWKAKTSPSVTYGTNGFFILKDGNGITDQSGEGNNFTLGGGTLTNLKDNPDNVFATWNYLDRYFTQANFSNGNATVQTPNASETYCTSTLGMSSGKYYMEVMTYDGSNRDNIGIVDSVATANNGSNNLSQKAKGYSYRGVGGVWNNDSQLSGTFASYGSPNYIMIAVDLDNSKLYFGKDGVWQNSSDPTSGSTGTGAISITPASDLSNGCYFFAVGDEVTSDDTTYRANFGNGYFGTTAITTNSGNGYAGAEGASKFNYTVPTGYSALSTKGLNE